MLLKKPSQCLKNSITFIETDFIYWFVLNSINVDKNDLLLINGLRLKNKELFLYMCQSFIKSIKPMNLTQCFFFVLFIFQTKRGSAVSEEDHSRQEGGDQADQPEQSGESGSIQLSR